MRIVTTATSYYTFKRALWECRMNKARKIKESTELLSVAKKGEAIRNEKN